MKRLIALFLAVAVTTYLFRTGAQTPAVTPSNGAAPTVVLYPTSTAVVPYHQPALAEFAIPQGQRVLAGPIQAKVRPDITAGSPDTRLYPQAADYIADETRRDNATGDLIYGPDLFDRFQEWRKSGRVLMLLGGTIVTILEEYRSFVKVSLPDGRQGYMDTFPLSLDDICYAHHQRLFRACAG